MTPPGWNGLCENSFQPGFWLYFELRCPIMKIEMHMDWEVQ